VDRLVDFGLPGLVFLVLIVWLLRKVLRAARTESDLEGERFTGAFAEELQEAKARAAAASSGQRPEEPAPPARGAQHPSEEPAQPATDGARRAQHPEDEVARLVTSAVQLAEPATPLSSADTRGISPQHLKLIEQAALEREQALRQAEVSESDVPRRVEILWARSTATHAVWCERRYPATQAAASLVKDVVCVALIEDGRIIDRWTY
jgi:hypothetical protein